MNRARKYFIDLYTRLGAKSFLNYTESYKQAYPKCARPHINGHRLGNVPEVKTIIDNRLRAMSKVTCEDITLTAQDILNKWENKPSIQLKALELIARLHKLLKDNEINTNTTIIGNLDTLKDREKPSTQPVNKPVNNRLEE